LLNGSQCREVDGKTCDATFLSFEIRGQKQLVFVMAVDVPAYTLIVGVCEKVDFTTDETVLAPWCNKSERKKVNFLGYECMNSNPLL
jgi:hypothetical protein